MAFGHVHDLAVLVEYIPVAVSDFIQGQVLRTIPNLQSSAFRGRKKFR
jgi:hypothetical protein